MRTGAQVGQASAIIQSGMARSTTMQGRAGLGHARASSLSWQEEAATCDAYRPIYPVMLLGMSFHPHLQVPDHSVLPLVGQKVPLLSVSLCVCVCSWISLWGICASVCHSVQRHTLGSLLPVLVHNLPVFQWGYLASVVLPLASVLSPALCMLQAFPHHSKLLL